MRTGSVETWANGTQETRTRRQSTTVRTRTTVSCRLKVLRSCDSRNHGPAGGTIQALELRGVRRERIHAPGRASSELSDLFHLSSWPWSVAVPPWSCLKDSVWKWSKNNSLRGLNISQDPLAASFGAGGSGSATCSRGSAFRTLVTRVIYWHMALKTGYCRGWATVIRRPSILLCAHAWLQPPPLSPSPPPLPLPFKSASRLATWLPLLRCAHKGATERPSEKTRLVPTSCQL